MSVFEILMLICFGAAWPVSIYKSWKSRTAGGKSLFFLVIIFLGYIFGVLHKMFFNFDYVLYLYLLNGVLVLIDILLVFRNRTFDRQKLEESNHD